MLKLISAFLFTLLPVLSAASNRIITEHFELTHDKPHHFTVYPPNEKGAFVASHHFDLSEDKQKVSIDKIITFSRDTVDEQVKNGIGSLVEIATHYYKPLFATQSVQAVEYRGNYLFSVSALPSYFYPLMEGGFRLSHAIGLTFVFTYTPNQTIIGDASQEDIKTALGLLQPIFLKLKGTLSFTYRESSRFSGADVKEATDLLVQVINREEDIDTCYALIGFLAVINEHNNHRALKDLAIKYAPGAKARMESEPNDDLKKALEILVGKLNIEATKESSCSIL